MEIGALAHKQEKKALITPSYNGIVNGKILLGLIYDPQKNNGTYLGIVYDIEHKKFKEESFLSLLNKFDYQNLMPFNIADIQKVLNLI